MEGRSHYRHYRSYVGRSTTATTSRSSPHSTSRSFPPTTSQLPRTPSLSPNSTLVHETDQSSTQAPSPPEAQAHYKMGLFEIDNEVGKVVSNCIKGYFTKPHANISQIPKKIVDTWFHMFAVIVKRSEPATQNWSTR
ncbi:predicted protein [Arabidopsis lyrata subsp. lyrata]|uniref:Predicted protein n=1 Tax=Arabidopsis lyrata subsp. lyrata TaxID=81972 RepID=D7L5E6_ARALL|nr:predicted protein [Arabidopsis lyrata subsp. lyrata]